MKEPSSHWESMGNRPGHVPPVVSEAPPRERLEWVLPAVYLAVAGAWVAYSDLLVAAVARDPAEQARWSLIKGLLFVLVTAAGLYLGMRAGLRRTRRAYLQVAQNEALLRVITSTIPEPIFLKDRQGRFLFANQALLSVVGLPATQVLGRTTAEVHGAAGPALQETDERIMSTGVGDVVEETIQTRTGEATFLSIKEPFRDGSGQVVGLAGTARDVTGERRVRAALARSELRFRALLERATDVLVVLDADGWVQSWSPGTTEALGWSAAEMINRPVQALVHPEDQAQLRPQARELRTTPGSTARVRMRVRHRDGSWRSLEVLGRNLLADPNVEGVVCNGRDVTEEGRLVEQFLQAQKLESLGRLAGGVAHDFNNLLTVILSCASALQGDGGTDRGARAEQVEQILLAAQRARDLTRQLLGFARKQVAAPEVLDLNRAVQEGERLLQRLVGEDVHLVVEPGTGVGAIRCDPGQLEQVLFNLVVNARDAMPGGGRITLATAPVVLEDAAAAAYPGLRPGPHARLQVRDTGCGMPPEVLAHVFEPFFTTKPEGKGTGLGLASVYGIVRQNQGAVGLASTPGQGTTVEVLFPVDAGVPKPRSTPLPAATARGSETVLVVEDDPLVQRVTVRALKSAGYQVLLAGSGAEALERAQSVPGPVHLLLTDVVMPGMSGVEAADRLRGRFPSLRVLFVSGYTEEAVAERGVPGGGMTFLAKPFTPETLLTQVRAVLDGP